MKKIFLILILSTYSVLGFCQFNSWFFAANDTILITPCTSAVQYEGGLSYPTTTYVTIGNNTGVVTLDYNAFGIPDKFIVLFDDVEVINTGYRGNPEEQVSLDNALAGLGEPSETIQGLGSGSASFNKTTSSTIAIIRVYAPLSSTSWIFTLSCPVPL